MSFRVIAELLSLPSGQGLCNAVSYYRRQNNLGSGIGQGGHKSSWVARKIKAEGREQMSRGMEVCPNCGAPMPVDHVDIGVGFQRFPAYCQRCGYDEKAETGSFLRDFEEPDLKKVIKPEKLDI